MLKQNMHIHSKHSWDSNMSLEIISSELIEKGIYYAGITDHIEFSHETLPYVLTNLKIRNEEIDKLNDKYKGKIKLLKGVEISSPHLYKDKVDALRVMDIDYIIGSIHSIDKTPKTSLAKKQATYKYYEEMLKMIKANQIDVVGHIDYINRYYDGDYTDYNQLAKLFALMKQNNIITEINTSAQRRNAKQAFFPSLDKIKLYSKTSDKIIIGSDAHESHELFDDLDKANYIARYNDLKPVIFEKRKMKEMKPPTYS